MPKIDLQEERWSRSLGLGDWCFSRKLANPTIHHRWLRYFLRCLLSEFDRFREDDPIDFTKASLRPAEFLTGVDGCEDSRTGAQAGFATHSDERPARLVTILFSSALACSGGEKAHVGETKTPQDQTMYTNKSGTPKAGTTKATRERHGRVEVARPKPEQHGKIFRGITFKTESESVVVSYNGNDVFARFDGREVLFDGTIHQPKGQALIIPHVRVGRVVLAKPTGEDLIIEISAAESVCGSLVTEVVPEGQKASGKSRRYFRLDGRDHFLAQADLPDDGVYSVDLRLLLLNPKYAPALHAAMTMHASRGWIENWTTTTSCEK